MPPQNQTKMREIEKKNLLTNKNQGNFFFLFKRKTLKFKCSKKKKKQIMVKLIIAKNHKSQLFLKKVIKAGIKKTDKSFNLANAGASTDKHYIESYENAVEVLVEKYSKATLKGFCMDAGNFFFFL